MTIDNLIPDKIATGSNSVEQAVKPDPAKTDDTVIAVRNISKMYPLYAKPNDRLKQSLWYALPKFLRGKSREFYREFWALRDVSFEVKRGESMGVIGRNGSGKSTLLQIIAETLAPTHGEIQINGRVAALLELGSGFNPEFTGRENVYMNGAIIGLSRAEIDGLYDEIAAFADIGNFIDQPVKLYSSGMRMRLAFAVQVFVPKEILIVDEALSVGDIFFRAKCMTRMQRLLDDGVTILFVSHDVGAVKSICRWGLLLEQGRVIDYNAADKIVEKYLAIQRQADQQVLTKNLPKMVPPKDLTDPSFPQSFIFTNISSFEKRASFERVQNGQAHFANVQLLNQNGEEVITLEYNQPVILRMAIEIHSENIPRLGFGYHIKDKNGVSIVNSNSAIENKFIYAPHAGERYIIDWHFRAALKKGNYNISTILSIPIDIKIHKVDFCDSVPLAFQFSVTPCVDAPLYGAVHWDNKVEIHQYGSDRFKVVPK